MLIAGKETAFKKDFIEKESVDYKDRVTSVLHFLNDEEFARLYIESKLDIKKWGLNRIGYQLHALGVPRETIDKCLDEYRDSTDEYATALSLAEKKLSSLTKDDREARYRKLSGFLGRKGYSCDVISRVIHELL